MLTCPLSIWIHLLVLRARVHISVVIYWNVSSQFISHSVFLKWDWYMEANSLLSLLNSSILYPFIGELKISPNNTCNCRQRNPCSSYFLCARAHTHAHTHAAGTPDGTYVNITADTKNSNYPRIWVLTGSWFILSTLGSIMSKTNTLRIRFKWRNVKEFRCKSNFHGYFFNCGKVLAAISIN